MENKIASLNSRFIFKGKFATFLLVTVLIGLVTIASAEEKKSLRDLFVRSENTDAVIAIDDHYTHVFPKITQFGSNTGRPTKEFTQELITACDTRLEIKSIDPLNSKEVWTAYDGKSNIYARLIKDQVTHEYKTVTGARCVDRFEIVDVWGEMRPVFTGGSEYFIPRNFVIKHDMAQSYIYKQSKVPPIEQITMLHNGEINSLDSKSKGGFFSKMLSLNKPSSEELFQYVTALCKKENGIARIIVKSGRFVEKPGGKVHITGESGYLEYSLSESTMLNGYKYIFTGNFKNSGSEKEWYFACEGQHPFVVREKETIRYGDRGNAISSVKAFFAINRGLEEIDYAPISVNTNTQPSSMTSKVPVTAEENMAVEVAAKKTNLFKIVGAQEYVGIYNGQDSQKCDMVSVEKNWNVDNKNSRKDTYNYSICSGVIAKFSETGIESLPSGIDTFVQRLAKVAQKIGAANGDYQGYTVKASALRDKDQCEVEVKIFKDINMISNKIINGCQ